VLKKKFGHYLMYLLPLGVLIVFIIILVAIKKLVPTTSTLPPPAEPTPTPRETFPLSPWATDSGVLQIEKENQEVEKNLQSVDLHEVKLLPPMFDMEVEL
jgi:hypothetical protein